MLPDWFWTGSGLVPDYPDWRASRTDEPSSLHQKKWGSKLYRLTPDYFSGLVGANSTAGNQVSGLEPLFPDFPDWKVERLVSLGLTVSHLVLLGLTWSDFDLNLVPL